MKQCIGVLGVFLLALTGAAREDSAGQPPEYPDHTDLSSYRDEGGKDHPIKTKNDWEKRRKHIALHMQRVMGSLPTKRGPTDVKILGEEKVGKLIRRKITFRSDSGAPVPAYIYLPTDPVKDKRPAVLCLHQTTKFGKNETAGVGGDGTLKYGLELAERGFITLMPDYPGFGEHKFKLDTQKLYVSGTMKAINDNIAAVDVLCSLPEVDAKRIGVIGHSLGGHNAMFTAFFEPRLVAIVSSCGFTTFRKDDMPSWTGLPYMPRIKTVFDNDARKVPFDFQEVVAGFAPRAFLAVAAEKDSDFDVGGVREVMKIARPIYELYGAAENLAALYPPGPHAFPETARRYAYVFLGRHLKK